MNGVVLNSKQAVTLVGAGPVEANDLARALRIAPTLVAADGGADRAVQLGYRPDLIIGDMDSVASLETWRNSGIQIHHIQDQQTTDFEKCLRSVEAPLILGCGFLGGRLDHALAALSALLEHGGKPAILIGRDDLCFHCPSSLAIDLPPGTRVSLYPLRAVRGVRSSGLEWALDGLLLEPGGLLGTSNRSTAPRVELALDGMGALLLLPPEMLEAAVAALNTPGR